jgi:hypothetical protein
MLLGTPSLIKQPAGASDVLQVAISVSRLLGRYSRRPDLNARMPGFSVQMGFGLHVGWAIEGAIGERAAAHWHCPLLSGRVTRCSRGVNITFQALQAQAGNHSAP